MTPPELAADILHAAYMKGDIEGKEVLDLGTGTGVLSIGAALIGADVTAVDKDKKALEIAKNNAEDQQVREFIDFKQSDISNIDGDEHFDTVVMNPPFSVHSESDISFIRKAVELSDAVYTISHPGLRSRIKDFVGNSEHRIEAVESYQIALPATYGFHTEESRETEVDVLITRKT